MYRIGVGCFTHTPSLRIESDAQVTGIKTGRQSPVFGSEKNPEAQVSGINAGTQRKRFASQILSLEQLMSVS